MDNEDIANRAATARAVPAVGIGRLYYCRDNTAIHPLESALWQVISRKPPKRAALTDSPTSCPSSLCRLKRKCSERINGCAPRENAPL